ncbi:MAG: histidine phosphatase family protein, partial [Pseudomonadota bacterium]
LSRARETAETLARGRTVALDARLVERSWGTWEGQRAADLAADPKAGFVPTHRLTGEARAPGGESETEVLRRLAPFLAERAGRGPAVIVTHKAVMRAVLAAAGAPLCEDGAVSIRRARLYPLSLAPDGTPSAPQAPVRLVPRP